MLLRARITLQCAACSGWLCCSYDAAHDLAGAKDENGRHRDVEEDEFQKRVANYLKPRHVDPEDKSFRAYRTRFR